MNGIDEVAAYAKAVVSKKVLTNKYVYGSCERHLRDLKNSSKRGLYFDVEAANDIFEFCRHVLKLNGGEHEGVAFNPLPWQCFVLGSIFGWKKENGLRRFKRAYIETAKGSGKSPMAAAVGLYGLIADGEARAEIYAAAAKKEQAQILFRDAVAMIRQSPLLSENLVLSGGEGREYNVAHHKSGSWFKPISSDKKKSGERPFIALVDELHEHPDRNTLEMLERGFKGRAQPLLYMITNSGSSRTSVCFEEHEHACKVAIGEIDDDTTFSFVCGLDDSDDPFIDEECWIKANPSLGVTIQKEYLRDAVKQARQMPSKQNTTLRLNFCKWTEGHTAWLEREALEGCEDDSLNIENFAGKDCWLGLDLSATRDITGKVYFFEDGVDEEFRPKFALFAIGYLPMEGLVEKARNDRAPYDVWVQQGHLLATDGKVARLDTIAADLKNDTLKYNVVSIAFDVWLSQNFKQILDDISVELPLIEHPQGWNRRKHSSLSMPNSIDFFERLILEGRLRIKPNPAFRSAVMGAQVALSPVGLRKFEKTKSTTRIDLAVAAAMAAGAADASSFTEKTPNLSDYLASL